MASSVLSASSSPSARNCRSSSPSVMDASSSDQAAKSQSLSSHHCGARVLYAAIGGGFCVGSRSLLGFGGWGGRAEGTGGGEGGGKGVFWERGGRGVFWLTGGRGG